MYSVLRFVLYISISTLLMTGRPCIYVMSIKMSKKKYVYTELRFNTYVGA